MTEMLTLDHGTGSQEIILGEPLDEELSQSLLRSTQAVLASRGDDALDVLDLEFAVHAATNGFGDEFLALVAWVSPERLAQYRVALDDSDAGLRRAAAAVRNATNSAGSDEREVRFVAIALGETIVRGVRGGEYRFEAAFFDSGGFARIHRARSPSGEVVAFKRLHARDEEAIARFRREIQEQQRIDHPAVMRILDHDKRFRWFVMPLAAENLSKCWVDKRLDEALLLRVLRQAMAGLTAAHQLGLIHRDFSPRNILRIGEDWVVADWGVVRRPPGLTTLMRTQGELGSLGFAAPELFRDGHAAGPSADVYALGRIAGWAITHEWPEQNVALIPPAPWDLFVRPATEHDPTRRPQSMAQLRVLLDEVETPPAPIPAR